MARWLAAAVALLGCEEGGAAPSSTVCPDAEARLGHRVCVHEARDAALWADVTFAAAAVDQARATTYMMPAREDARLATLLVDATAFEMPEQSLHHRFLTESFPEFETMEYEQYLELTQDAALREWFAGSVTEFIEPPAFAFTVWDPDASVTCDRFSEIHAGVARMLPFGEVVVAPADDVQRTLFAECDVPSFDPSQALDYEAYTKAKGCGTLRRFTLAELAAAEVTASFGWQDIIVVDQAPLDVETIVSGIVTGTRQGELSHLNVRSASRGTPNCFVKGAVDLLADFEGQLVSLDCGPAGATVVPITPEEAQLCWDGVRPDPVDIVPADLEWTELVPLLDVPTQTPEERRTAVSRFGSKGANLGTLYQRIDPAIALEGFLIPFAYYDAFARDGGFAPRISGMLADPTFRTDGALRRAQLEALRVDMEAGTCDPDLVSAIETQILAVFGGDSTMVRFRSSSNAEDALGFNGAGLYDSTSACLADETDADATGPSHCDPDKSSERDICRALKRVWSSLWSMKAYEEREWYGIDHSGVVMGILVNTRTKAELANIVGFTGNPLLRGDDRYLVNAQLGELDVVSALPGVWPEQDFLTVEGGAVVAIERGRGSTELPEGQWVLDDARLQELGAALAEIVAVYPIDEEVPITATVLLDTEWKLRNDGRLAIKQVRPFLE